MITGKDVLVEPQRGRWGRPVVNGSPKVRCSKFAKALDGAGGLPPWFGKQTAKGLAASPDLMARAATLDPSDDTGWRDLTEQAMERAGSSSGATLGTAIHDVSERVDRGEDISMMPPALQAAGEGYQGATEHLEPLAAEMFVYCERWDTAGTFDRLYRTPDGRVVVGDLKTTSRPDAWKYSQLSWALQLCQYQAGKPYCAQKGLLEWSDLGLTEPDPDIGIIIQIQRDTGETRLIDIDLRAGRVAADLAARVEKARKYGFASISPP